MSRLFAFVVAALLAVSHVAAFTSPRPATSVSTLARDVPSAPFTTSNTFESTTALNLKVKVDPEAAKKGNSLGNAKMAA